MVVKRIFLLVIDAVDANVLNEADESSMTNILRLWQGGIGSTATLEMASGGKDAATGHWELAGIVSGQAVVETLSCDTIMDLLKMAGNSVVSIGRVKEIFAGKGISRHVIAEGNEECMEKVLVELNKDYYGLCFASLPECSADKAGTLSKIDQMLGQVMDTLKRGDILMVTASAGEAVPFMVYGQGVKSGIELGTRESMADVAASISKMMRIPYKTPGISFWNDIKE